MKTMQDAIDILEGAYNEQDALESYWDMLDGKPEVVFPDGGRLRQFTNKQFLHKWMDGAKACYEILDWDDIKAEPIKEVLPKKG